MSHWSTRYIGLPYRLGGREKDGIDCWGLVRLIYRDEKGVDLPSLPGIASAEMGAIVGEIGRESQQTWQEVSTPVEMCAVAMSQRLALHHVGVWAGADGGKVIHAWGDMAVIADTLRNLRIRGFQTIKFFCYGPHH